LPVQQYRQNQPQEVIVATTRTILFLLGLLVAGQLAAPPVLARSTYDLSTVAIVRLYSDGKQVGSWQAIDRGRMDGNCYVFHVKKGVREPEIRVCGTIVVEAVR
jgi:hypothetical protein